MHRRLSPKPHGFRYRIALFALDLDELDALHRRLRLFSFGRANLYSFRDGDYLPNDTAEWNSAHPPAPAHPRATEPERASLKSRVLALLATHGLDLAGGRVELLTMPRVAGHLFNPVSFYFCHDRMGECVAVIPEVTNTFREMKPFFLGPDTRRDGAFRLRVPKHFYVSPFSDVDVAFDFTLRPPGADLALQIDDFASGQRTLTSTLTGRARPLTDAALLALTLRHPLQPLHTITRIHWHALRLWASRVPWFAKSARADEQRGLFRPHVSLTDRPAETAPPAVSPTT
jgi:DUF1365 family protein